jgi:hypothetical protein
MRKKGKNQGKMVARGIKFVFQYLRGEKYRLRREGPNVTCPKQEPWVISGPAGLKRRRRTPGETASPSWISPTLSR